MGRSPSYRTEQEALDKPAGGPLIDKDFGDRLIFKQGETAMGDKGKRDKGRREQQKKAQHNPKEKRRLKKEKKNK